MIQLGCGINQMQQGKLSEVIAQALIDAKVSVCTHVPGYGGTETFREYQNLLKKKVPYSFHEEVAYTISHGAALAGSRSACLIKTHGFAKATNSVLSSLSSGTLGGFVVFAFDDKKGSHSDNILRASEFIHGSEIPFEHLDGENPYEQILQAYSRSESLQLPVALIVSTDQIQIEFEYERRKLNWTPPAFHSRPEHSVVCPPMAGFQRKIFESKISGLSLNPDAKPDFELQIPQGLPSPLKEAATSYVPVFDAFHSSIRKLNHHSTLVSGDAGTSTLFAFSPFRCIDFGTYMGGSTSLAIGSYLAGYRKSWAVTGDFSFISAGHLGLFEAYHFRIPLKLLILDNKKASATGNQPIESDLLKTVLQPYSNSLSYIRSQDSPNQIQKCLIQAHESSELAIVIAEIE